ncbi:C-type natriuretic peptide-like [Microcaecilia unicolor]|uniref:C-type natriuretic peptide-like n=1 Tax=Microcaecilia unicolor TaxID=1415580 RepID=A0A6P7WPI2_9AMPH|nr:C-type natriuretic peptide-like [Microcaecilia unicolor]
MRASLWVFFLLSLVLCVQSKPVQPRRHHKVPVDLLREDSRALVSVEQTPATSQQTSPEPRPLREAPADSTATESTSPSSNRGWLRFFNDFMNNQKKFRGRTKKMPSQGCFGAKLDRIGALSGFGC